MFDFFDAKFSEIFSAQLVSMGGGMIAGTLLAFYSGNLLLVPGMLILLPGFLEMRGNISGSIAARITSGLFLGAVNPRQVNSKIVRGNVFASFLLALIVSFSLGFIAFLFNLFVFHIFALKIILIAVVAGVIANLIEIPLTIFFTFYLFRRGHDPGNIMGPFVTSTGDITSVVALLIAMVLL